MFECDNAYRRSVAVLCMLYKIRRYPVHPLNGALPGLYLSVRVTRGALVALRYTYAPPRCRTSQYYTIFIFLSVSLWNDLVDPVFDDVGLPGFKSKVNVFFIGLSCSTPTIEFYYFSLSLLSVYRLVLWGWSLRTDRVYITLSQPCTADLFFTNDDNNKYIYITCVVRHVFPLNHNLFLSVKSSISMQEYVI